MVFTHTLSSLVTLIALILILITQYTYGKLVKKPQEKINITALTLILLVIFTLALWTNAYYYPTMTFLDAVVGGLFNTLAQDLNLSGKMLQSPGASPLNRVWYHMFIGLTAIGTLSWVSVRMRNNLRMAFIAGTVLLALIVFLLPALNIKVFVTPRWVPFIITIGATLVAQAIMTIPSIVKWRMASLALTVMVIFALSMFSINSTVISSHSILTKEATRREFLQSELTAADTISDKHDGVIFSDWEYINFIYAMRYNIKRLDYLAPEIQEEDTDLFVVREFLRKHPELIPFDWRVAGNPPLEEIYELFTKFDSSDYNLVYNHSEVKAYSPK